jgi:1-acyl-sn-glycerol-3-phosphate acyltransferase
MSTETPASPDTAASSEPASPAAPEPALPPPATAPYIEHGGGFLGALGRTWLRVAGWRCDPRVPGVKKAVLVAAPHTSNWDLPFSLALSFVLDIKISWVGKHTLFQPPLGTFMRAIGGVPVDRRGRNDAVKSIAKLFEGRDELMLMVPPEGTRGRAKRWKTGFYYIALEAKVPIVLGFVDFGNKVGGLGEVFWPTGDIRKDFEHLRKFYAGMKGKYPELQGEITLDDEAG